MLQQAAQKGDAVAMHKIGRMYELGTYVDKDYTWAMLMHNPMLGSYMKMD